MAAAQPKSTGTYDTLIKLLLIGDSGDTRALSGLSDPRARPTPRVKWEIGVLVGAGPGPPLKHCSCTGVGKSCLLLRFSEDSFQTSFITTIGCAHPPSFTPARRAKQETSMVTSMPRCWSKLSSNDDLGTGRCHAGLLSNAGAAVQGGRGRRMKWVR